MPLVARTNDLLRSGKSKSLRTIDREKKLAIGGFNHNGHSSHSAEAMLLPYIINYCEAHKIPYRLIAQPGLGYYIERIPKE